MNDDCTRFDELIGQDDPHGAAEIETHAAACRTCRARLDEWNATSLAAKDLHESWESPDLWNRIESEIRRDAARVPARRAPILFPRPGSLLQAAALLLVMLGLGVFLVREIAPGVSVPDDRAQWEEWVLRESAIQEVEQSEVSHLASIQRLESLTGPGLAEAETPLMISYREKLMLLDEAIAECQTQIDQNRYNTHLRRQLLAVYTEKDRTLREVLEETHEQ